MSKKENIEIKYWDIKKLIGAEYNPRQITEKQFQDLTDSIKRFGFQDPIIVNVNKDRHGVIIAGHQRRRVAESLKMDKLPVVEVDLTLEQEKEFNIRHNKNQGEFDVDALANFFEIDELKEYGFEDWELGIEDYNVEDYGQEEEQEQEEKPKTIKITLQYSEEEHEKVINALSEHGDTPEQAVWKLLKLD